MTESASNASHIDVKAVFFKLGLLYGHAWAHPLLNPTWAAGLKAQWQTILKDMTQASITQVFNYLQSSDNNRYVDFPPTALQFLHLAKTLQKRNLPDENTCYLAAIAGNWALHPIVKPIAIACDLYWLRKQATDHQARMRFAQHYANVVERFLAKKPLSEPSYLPSRKQSPSNTHNSPSQNNAPPQRLTAFQIIHQRADRMLATPGVLDRIRAAKTAQEKMTICQKLWHQYAREDEAVAKAQVKSKD
jgi:hypothetical protein